MAGVLVGLIGLLTVVGSATGMIKMFGPAARADLITHKVQYERLQLTITERGQLESADNKEVVCRVKARSPQSTVASSIRWIIDDGKEVKKGDKLIQLDDSGLYEQLKEKKIALDNAYAAWVQAETEYTIAESENKSAIATAKLTLDLALIDLEKYEKGDLVQTLQEIEGRLMIARSDLAMWEERAAWSSRMSKPGRRYVTSAQAQADEARLKSAKIQLSKVEEEIRVLKDYTAKRQQKDLQGKIDEARRALERVQALARAKEVKAEADRKAKKSIYDQEWIRHQDIEEEIKKCVITSPQSGLVVYYISEQSRWSSGSQQSIIAQGEPVREGQKLMRIPDLSKMVVNTRVHEAMVSRVRGERWQKTGFSDAIQASLLLTPGPWTRLAGQKAFDDIREEFVETNKHFEQVKLADGQPAQVRIDAFPDRVLNAEVKTVATVASQQDWLSADVKVYQTMVAIKESVGDLKPGMSAEVTIFTDSARSHCLTIPVQSILGSVDMGNKRRVYVQTATGHEAREVVIGLSNDKMAEVESGLQEGDLVVVNPRLLLSEKEKAKFGDSGPYRYSPNGGGGAPGKDGKGKGGWPGKGGPGKGGPPKGGPPKGDNGNGPA
jgi:multidrug efflux pump subunit AcrA (membrane-fusion protein)